MSEAKKELGQHWLRDKEILRAIVEAGNVRANDTVLEIGPGEGTLTEVLVSSGADVVALEFDESLIGNLRMKFGSNSNINIEQGDVRKFDFSSLSKNYKIVANIPYYLTSNLIRLISETKNQPAIAVLLVQKEVARRICAGPGDMSLLSVGAQFYFECQLDIEVSAQHFTPPPKVDSQVVVLKRRPNKLFEVDEKQFFRVVRAGFSEKRKTLRNSLSGGLAIDKPKVEELLARSGVSPNARAQELSLSQWNNLYIEASK